MFAANAQAKTSAYLFKCQNYFLPDKDLLPWQPTHTHVEKGHKEENGWKLLDIFNIIS